MIAFGVVPLRGSNFKSLYNVHSYLYHSICMDYVFRPHTPWELKRCLASVKKVKSLECEYYENARSMTNGDSEIWQLRNLHVATKKIYLLVHTSEHIFREPDLHF